MLKNCNTFTIVSTFHNAFDIFICADSTIVIDLSVWCGFKMFIGNIIPQ